MNRPALFVRDGHGFRADPLADGPWAPGALHGGAPAALLAHLLAQRAAEVGLRLARLTCEFVRPTPHGPLSLAVDTLRPGRRVTLLEAALADAEGTIVTRARALLLRPTELGVPDRTPPPFAGPEAGAPAHWGDPRPMFARDALDIRFVEGALRTPGPATAWFRLRGPVLEGEPVHGASRIAAASDFPNGISAAVSWEGHTFINADLTLHIERDPVDEWVALQARTRLTPGSTAFAAGVLFDRRGRVGHTVQSLLVERAPVPRGDATAPAAT